MKKSTKEVEAVYGCARCGTKFSRRAHVPKCGKCGYRVLKRSVTVEYVNETYVEPYDEFLDHGVQAVNSRAS